ncbi:hypothetical protein TrST_g1848 [Triparma strigata]|uniref:Uncharacterized protein n=1 Tax=Triparma strigata TaxID=1606541 RepID=A0A9W7BJW1_9STRA|nr:hypothetical protein TrST_g1848 [Triparma strigata]
MSSPPPSPPVPPLSQMSSLHLSLSTYTLTLTSITGASTILNEDQDTIQKIITEWENKGNKITVDVDGTGDHVYNITTAYEKSKTS